MGRVGALVPPVGGYFLLYQAWSRVRRAPTRGPTPPIIRPCPYAKPDRVRFVGQKPYP